MRSLWLWEHKCSNVEMSATQSKYFMRTHCTSQTEPPGYISTLPRTRHMPEHHLNLVGMDASICTKQHSARWVFFYRSAFDSLKWNRRIRWLCKINKAKISTNLQHTRFNFTKKKAGTHLSVRLYSCMAPWAGLEPATYGLTVHRSTNWTIRE